jgi:hypothetical protein
MVWIDQPILIHVGLHKTATSWLQEYYLTREANGFWVPPIPPSLALGMKGPDASRRSKDIKLIGRLIVSDSKFRLVPEEDFDAEKIRYGLSDLEKPPNLMPVVSNERLAGHPLSNGFDRQVLAERICRIFPNARVLLTIREQKSIILSNYMQYLKFGGWHSVEKFLQPPSDTRQPVLTLHYWDYAKLITSYHRIFGTDNVLVLPQELLRRSPLEFVGRIASFAGVQAPQQVPAHKEANPRRPHAAFYYLRGLTALGRKSSGNAFYPSLLGVRLGRGLNSAAKSVFSAVIPRSLDQMVKNSLERRVEAIVGDYYRASNRQVVSLTNLDLKALGYDL